MPFQALGHETSSLSVIFHEEDSSAPTVETKLEESLRQALPQQWTATLLLIRPTFFRFIRPLLSKSYHNECTFPQKHCTNRLSNQSFQIFSSTLSITCSLFPKMSWPHGSSNNSSSSSTTTTANSNSTSQSSSQAAQQSQTAQVPALSHASLIPLNGKSPSTFPHNALLLISARSLSSLIHTGSVNLTNHSSNRRSGHGASFTNGRSLSAKSVAISKPAQPCPIVQSFELHTPQRRALSTVGV